MMKNLLSAATAAILSVGVATAAPVAFTLSADGDTLIGLSVTDGSVVSNVEISGDATDLDAIDVRPSNGQLIGFDSASDQYFVVDPLTGSTTVISNASGTPTVSVQTSNNLDIDWNPTIDRMRLVDAMQDLNVVFNPDNGGTTQVTDVFYVAGDTNNGRNPSIVGNAYTNSFDGAMSTVQYVIDAATDDLAILGNNTGELTTIGQLTLDGSNFRFTQLGGFDIFTDEGGNEVAYALLRANTGEIGLFTVNLATAALTSIGSVSFNGENLTGLAIVDMQPVPLPAAGLLFLTGLAGVRTLRRRKNKAA